MGKIRDVTASMFGRKFKTNDEAFLYAAEFLTGGLVEDYVVIGQVVSQVRDTYLSNDRWRVRLAGGVP